MIDTSAPTRSVPRRREATVSARDWLVLVAAGAIWAGWWAKRFAGIQSPAAAASGNRARTFTTDLLVLGNVRGHSDRCNMPDRLGAVKRRGPGERKGRGPGCGIPGTTGGR